MDENTIWIWEIGTHNSHVVNLELVSDELFAK